MDEVDKISMSFEPMDVDLSGNSVLNMDISFNSSENSPRGNDNNRHTQGRETPNTNRKEKITFDNVDLDTLNITDKGKLSGYDRRQSAVTPNLNSIVSNSTSHGVAHLPVLSQGISSSHSTDITRELDKSIKTGKSSGTIIKKYHIKREKQNVQQTSSSLKIFGLSLFFLGIAILLYSINNLKCSGDLDLANLKDNLNKHLFGQQFAIDDIIDALSVEAKSKIIFLYGGTGVGKTFAVSFILNSMLSSSNVYHYTMPNFVNTFPNELMLGLTMCKNSMIIVDDLTGNHDTIIKSHIKNAIEKSENLARNITIILIFNCDIVQKDFIKKCDMSFGANLQKSFSDVIAVKTLIKFNPLSEEHLRKCIEREINGVILETDIKRIMSNFNVSLDGCKGVFHKIRVLNNI